MSFAPRVNDSNPDPRVACVILLDTSESMRGDAMQALNDGFGHFCDAIKEDPLARKRTEVAVITFGGSARLEIPFTEGRQLGAKTFAAGGSTPLGSALDMAVNEIALQKAAYKESGIEYYRPWLFVMTDGEPTDDPRGYLSQNESG